MEANRREAYQRLSLSQYRRYALIGALVGVATVCFREFAAFCLPADNAVFYVVSILLAYAFGIILSFSLQLFFTFHRRPGDRNLETFGRFLLVAVLGAASTSALASLIRYGMDLDVFLGDTAATGAFIAAAFLSSVLTYALSAQFVFRHTS